MSRQHDAPVKSVEVADGVLKIVRTAGEGKQDVFEARLEGGMLKGQVTYPDGKVHHFEGRKAPILPTFKTSAAWRTIKPFDGKTLNGWHPRDPKAKNGWAVVDGELAVVDPKGNSDLVSDAKFQDMQLHLEFNIEPKSNSGVYLRGRYEVQILDNPDAKMALDTHGCGAVRSPFGGDRGAWDWPTAACSNRRPCRAGESPREPSGTCRSS